MTGPDERRLAAVADRVRDAVAPAIGPDAELLGPAPRFRRRGRFRRRLLIKTLEPEREIAAIGAAIEAPDLVRELRDVTLAVDVDPQ